MIFKASASSINVASEPDCKMHFTISSDCPETDKPGPAIMQSAHVHHFVSSSQLLFLSLYVSHIDSGTSVKTKIILFDTDLINFTDDDFVCGEADITEQREDGLDGAGENTLQENEDCSDCPYFCPVCSEGMYEDDCEE